MKSWLVFVIVPKNLAAGNFFRASSCSGESLLVTSQSALGQLARQQADGFKSQSIFRLQVTTWENLSASGHYFALSSLLCETIFTKRKSHQKLSFPDAEKFLDDVRFSQHVPNMTHEEFFWRFKIVPLLLIPGRDPSEWHPDPCNPRSGPDSKPSAAEIWIFGFWDIHTFEYLYILNILDIWIFGYSYTWIFGYLDQTSTMVMSCALPKIQPQYNMFGVQKAQVFGFSWNLWCSAL